MRFCFFITDNFSQLKPLTITKLTREINMKNFKTVAKNVFYATSATLMCSVPAMAETAVSGVSLTVPDVDTSSLGAAGGAVLGLIALTAGVAIVIGVFKKSKSA
jgi:hypothetical protein